MGVAFLIVIGLVVVSEQCLYNVMFRTNFVLVYLIIQLGPILSPILVVNFVPAKKKGNFNTTRATKTFKVVPNKLEL